MNAFLETLLDTPLDDGYRGIPPGAGPIPLRDVVSRQWSPQRGDMALPVLTLDEAAFSHNTRRIFAYAKSHGALLCPHAKTPMSPQIVQRLIEAGAWGATVANLQQASVLLRAGIGRLMLGNEIGGRASGARLGSLLAQYPEARFLAFVDSPAAAAAIAAASETAGRPLEVLVEVGGGRAGARDDAGVQAVFDAIAACGGKLVPAGVATYEGAVASSDAQATQSNIDTLMARALQALAAVRKLRPDAPLILTAGGSAFFDLVVQAAQAALRADGNTQLVLRSGAIFFHDHGTYARALAGMDARQGFVVEGKVQAASDFLPALRLWSEVLSRPEPGLAILGMGMRDVSYDQDLPLPLKAYREGRLLEQGLAGDARITRLNDQHAFLSLDPSSPLQPGDVIELGISHPCTCLDRWRVFFGLDQQGQVAAAYRTFFG